MKYDKAYYENLLKEMGKEDKRYSLPEARKKLKVSLAEMWELTKSGDLPAEYEDGQWLFTESAILYYLNEVKLGDITRKLRELGGE